MTPHRNTFSNRFVYHFCSIFFSVLFIFPILWSLMASFRPEIDVFQGLSPLSINALLPIPFTFENMIGVFTNETFVKSLANTIFVSAVSIVIGVIINALAGFAFATSAFRGKKLLFSFVIASFLINPDLLVLPNYNIMDELGLIDTKIALILPVIGNGMVVFMFLQFFSQIPWSLMEAAVIDGASSMQIFLRIYIPLTIPTMIGASLVLFLAQWEAFLWPLVISRTPENQMVQVAMSVFTQQYGTLWGYKLAAASILCFIPLLILMPLQKYYVESIAGSIKG